jgi:hypothetical protein
VATDVVTEIVWLTREFLVWMDEMRSGKT